MTYYKSSGERIRGRSEFINITEINYFRLALNEVFENKLLRFLYWIDPLLKLYRICILSSNRTNKTSESYKLEIIVIWHSMNININQCISLHLNLMAASSKTDYFFDLNEIQGCLWKKCFSKLKKLLSIIFLSGVGLGKFCGEAHPRAVRYCSHSYIVFKAIHKK